MTTSTESAPAEGAPIPLRRPAPARRRAGWSRALNTWAVWLTVTVVLTSILPVFQNATVTSTGYELLRLKERRNNLEQVTYLLEADIARLQSLDRIEREARDRLRMVPADQVRPLRVPYAPTGLTDHRLLPPTHVKQSDLVRPPADLTLAIPPIDLLALVQARQ